MANIAFGIQNGGPSTDESHLISLLTGDGHTVTQFVVQLTDSPPFAGKDLAIMGPDGFCSSSTQRQAWMNASIPVIIWSPSMPDDLGMSNPTQSLTDADADVPASAEDDEIVVAAGLVVGNNVFFSTGQTLWRTASGSISGTPDMLLHSAGVPSNTLMYRLPAGTTLSNGSDPDVDIAEPWIFSGLKPAAAFNALADDLFVASVDSQLGLLGAEAPLGLHGLANARIGGNLFIGI